jgi:hypothetical protein
VGHRMLVQATTQGVVAVVDLELVVVVTHQPVEQVPGEVRLAPSAGDGSGCRVRRSGTGCRHRCAAGCPSPCCAWRPLPGAVELLGFIQQVARRVEGEGFGAQAAAGLQQAPKGSY